MTTYSSEDRLISTSPSPSAPNPEHDDDNPTEPVISDMTRPENYTTPTAASFGDAGRLAPSCTTSPTFAQAQSGQTPLSLRGGGLDTQNSTASHDDPTNHVRAESHSSPNGRKKAKEVSISEEAPQVIGRQASIMAYRERLAKEMERRELSGREPTFAQAEGKSTNSPIGEVERFFASPTPDSDIPTASTESNKTVRGAFTPGAAVRTPSYPFPHMATPNFKDANTTRRAQQYGLLNSAGGQFENVPSQEQMRSSPSTPVSAATFQPTGSAPAGENVDFPTPNLYELALALNAEPGMDAWWETVVQIMIDCYRAERVTLSVPADATDIDNVPWGQKATYNAHDQDGLSMGYRARGSSLVTTSIDDRSETLASLDDFSKIARPIRPIIQNRHSFTTYEDRKESRQSAPGGGTAPTVQRPGPILRSKSTYPTVDRPSPYLPRPKLDKEALEQHDAAEDQQQPLPNWEAPIIPGGEVKGRVLPVLQALDLEADPLIDHNGINRVVQRGRVIAITRNYPYLDQVGEGLPQPSSGSTMEQEESGPNQKKTQGKAKKQGAGEKNRMSTLLSTVSEPPARPLTPKYEEFEQPPPSPWSQSPAPSPAVRTDSNENPFFTDAVVDEGTFEPGPSPDDYTSIRVPETIGVDYSWTVLHIPLIHPLLSKPTQSFKLDSTILEQKNVFRGRDDHEASGHSGHSTETLANSGKSRRPPIAILSVLTPVIPYPSNLRSSLDHLASHLATSFSMCRHYSNLETEIAGLRRKRPSTTAGFGGVDAEGRPLPDPAVLSQLDFESPGINSHPSATGSITSPSDVSGLSLSRSVPGSQGGTPIWESGSLGLVIERRTPGNSPNQFAGDGYFSQRPRTSGLSNESLPGTSAQRALRIGKDANSPGERRHVRSGSLRNLPSESTTPDPVDQDAGPKPLQDLPSGGSRPVSKGSLDAREKTIDPQHGGEKRRNRVSSLPAQGQGGQKHSMLHSQGGDFATTFQSLPPSTSLFTKPTSNSQPPAQASSRVPALSGTQVSLAPPTDRLKGLMLDSLPVQVFVALPLTGEIVWVNSRYLTFRGQEISDLVANPWGSLHPDDREEYLQGWSHSLRTGDTFDRIIRLRRFDGQYRWHQARAITSRDKRGVIVQFIGSYMDIHDQHVAEVKALRQQQIEESEANYRLLANLIPQIIFTATEEEGITFANEQWASYTGQSTDSSRMYGFMDSVHPDDLAKCRMLAGRNLASPGKSPGDKPETSGNTTPGKESSRRSSCSDSSNANLNELARKGIIKVTTDSSGRPSYTTELRLRSKSGDYRWHLIRCVEIDNIDFLGQGASSYFGSATDINDHKLLEAKLKEAMESKSRFLSNMSHEIRTPLIGISGMVSFLQDTTLNEEQRDYTNTIQTSANSLLMIINDILDLSKVDAGMMKLKFEWFHTRSLIEDVNELVSTMAIAKRLELNYIVEENVPTWVKGDKVRIRQVLLNVIGNAIKFTSEGEVFSRCKVSYPDDVAIGEHEIQLEFSIIDTGRGFTKEEADLIFKPFSQIDGSSTRQHGGSGLGLVISRQLVELHGGKMEGSAVPGEGSTFTFTAKFTLPNADDHPDIPGTPPAPATAHHSLHEKAPLSAGPLILQKAADLAPGISPSSDGGLISPAQASSASSDPSVRSIKTQNTARSSMSSVNAGLVRFSEAAKASGQDLSQLKLEMPPGKTSPQVIPSSAPGLEHLRPPVYSILVISPQTHSREATTKHIEMTLPKDVPHQITAMATTAEAENLIGGHESVTFTHIVLNLGTPEEVLEAVDKIMASSGGRTSVLILSDSVQRQAVLKLASDDDHQRLLAEKRISFIYKPVKPSRFAVIFDPANERDLSIDLNRSSAAQMVESQKQNYLDVEKRIGNKGYKVLLVEDNQVNQKVLVRYLKKIKLDAEIAADGVECTEKVFSEPPNYYALVLCDLHMPRKDGYQACRDIRQWEKDGNHPKMPIVALSANVMSDVQEKCVAAGFDDYVTKPVDFVDLSKVMSKYI